MKMQKKTYKQLADSIAPKSPLIKDMAKAFVIGGLICTLGQVLLNCYKAMGFAQENAAPLTSVTLIGISAVLTALGLYDKLAKHAGAGTVVPITGFANSIVSSAIEFKTEGFVLGMCAKMFQLAGPVIVMGTTASVIYGLVYLLFV